MKNKVTFNTGTRLPRDKLSEIMASYPADIVHSNATWPDIRIIGKRRLPGAYNAVVDTLDSFGFDFRNYIGHSYPGLISSFWTGQFLRLTIQCEKRSRTYSFELHQKKDVRLLPNGNYELSGS